MKKLREFEDWARTLPEPTRATMLLMITAADVGLEWSWGMREDEDLMAAFLELEESLG